MKTVGLSKAKQKLSNLVDRAHKGERIGITRRGKLVAFIVPPRATIFADVDEIRKHVKPLKGITIRQLIEEGRQ